ncbi:MAG: polysaccharide deacetylase family protein [Gaiellales bacterium]
MANPRADYSPIVDRPPLRLPGDARVAIWPIVNVEEWEIDKPMARSLLPAPQGREVIPDIANFSWFDYGLRIGFWRIKEVLDRHGVRASLSLNASICDSHPRIVTECAQSEWEVLGHGYVQRVLNVEDDERDVIRRTLDRIEEFTGSRPRGWMGPGLAETFETPDILAEEGVDFVCDWCNDDQPYEMKVQSGRLAALPYTVELNDIPMYLVQHHRSPEIFERARDTFETLYREGESNARIMAISVHPYITGAAHRVGYYDRIFEYVSEFDGVAFMTGAEILDGYRGVEAA